MKYRVYGHVTGTRYLGEFEADSKDDAIEQALDSEGCWVHLCHQCSGEIDDPEVTDATAELIEDE